MGFPDPIIFVVEVHRLAARDCRVSRVLELVLSGISPDDHERLTTAIILDIKTDSA
jgi:hypothetical protein